MGNRNQRHKHWKGQIIFGNASRELAKIIDYRNDGYIVEKVNREGSKCVIDWGNAVRLATREETTEYWRRIDLQQPIKGDIVVVVIPHVSSCLPRGYIGKVIQNDRLSIPWELSYYIDGSKNKSEGWCKEVRPATKEEKELFSQGISNPDNAPKTPKVKSLRPDDDPYIGKKVCITQDLSEKGEIGTVIEKYSINSSHYVISGCEHPYNPSQFEVIDKKFPSLEGSDFKFSVGQVVNIKDPGKTYSNISKLWEDSGFREGELVTDNFEDWEGKEGTIKYITNHNGIICYIVSTYRGNIFIAEKGLSFSGLDKKSKYTPKVGDRVICEEINPGSLHKYLGQECTITKLRDCGDWRAKFSNGQNLVITKCSPATISVDLETEMPVNKTSIKSIQGIVDKVDGSIRYNPIPSIAFEKTLHEARGHFIKSELMTHDDLMVAHSMAMRGIDPFDYSSTTIRNTKSDVGIIPQIENKRKVLDPIPMIKIKKR